MGVHSGGLILVGVHSGGPCILGGGAAWGPSGGWVDAGRVGVARAAVRPGWGPRTRPDSVGGAGA